MYPAVGYPCKRTADKGIHRRKCATVVCQYQPHELARATYTGEFSDSLYKDSFHCAVQCPEIPRLMGGGKSLNPHLPPTTTHQSKESNL